MAAVPSMVHPSIEDRFQRASISIELMAVIDCAKRQDGLAREPTIKARALAAVRALVPTFS